MSLTGQYGSNLIDIKFDKLNGIKALGGYRLSFQLKATIKPSSQSQNIVFEHLKGEVKFGNVSLGTAHTQGFQSIVLFDTPRDDYPLHLYLDLDRVQLDAIEEMRNGEDLTMDLWLYALCREGNSPGSVSDNIKLSLNQRAWTDVLTQMGYGRFFTFEVPFPVAGEDNFGAAISYIERAKESFFRGDYEETVSHCRNALENLHAHLPLKNKMEEAKNQFCGKGKRNMDLGERVYLLHESIRHITHLSHHPEGAEYGEKYSRKDAKLVLSMTASIIAHSQGQ